MKKHRYNRKDSYSVQVLLKTSDVVGNPRFWVGKARTIMGVRINRPVLQGNVGRANNRPAAKKKDNLEAKARCR